MKRAACAVVVLLGVLAGGVGFASDEGNDHDPWQSFNRPIFRFNDAVDRWVLEPVAKGYTFVAPEPLRRCVSNFFQNLRVPINGVNDLLQWKPVASASDVGRFAVNTTVGLAGFFDPATYFGLVRHDEDFGQTLGVWGVPPGPYLVLPLFGPSTVRDTGGLVADAAITPTWYFVDAWITISGRLGDAVNSRSLVLKEVEDARAAALDWYASVRHAYLQHREAEVRDSREIPREINDNLYFPDEGAPK
jgi:phospholipid-binding lipoprotein MlaA